MIKAKRIQLNEPDAHQRVRLLGEKISLSEGPKKSWVTLTRTGSFYHPQFGRFEHNQPLFEAFIKNFTANTYGQDVAIDVAHKPENGAAGYIRDLRLDGNKLRALVEWTEYGIDAVKNKGHVYLSVDYTTNYTDNENQNEHGPLLFGAGLVVRPHIKHLDRVVLAESGDDDTATIVHNRLAKQLQEEIPMKWAELIDSLITKVRSLKLAESIISEFRALAEKTLADVEEEARAKSIIDNLQNSAVKLAEAHPDAKSVTIQLSEGTGLSEADVNRILKENQDAQAVEQRKLQESLDAKHKLLAETIDAEKGLSDDVKASLKKELAEFVTADTSEEQIKKLAAREIDHANKAAANIKLSEIGFNINTPAGRVQFTNSPSSDAAKLQQMQHERLRQTSVYNNGNIRLSEDKDLPGFVREVLGVFDSLNAQKISRSVRTLSEGQTGMANTDLPVGFQREVIREALSDLNLLQLVSTYTDPTAQATTMIPYEKRGGGIANQGRTFERQAIQKVSVSQEMDLAYINAMKLAIDVSNEVMHYTQSSGINWDAWGRNVASAARLVREMLCQRIANEMQRSSDAFMAMDVFNETITVTGNIYKTAQFPVVRERQVYDQVGNAVGNSENPIVVKDGSTTLQAFDGSGQQPSGKYYHVVNYNLGYVVLVDEKGTPVSATGTVKISYSYATNIAKVDADAPDGDRYDVHLNKLLRAIGAQKAILSSERFISPDFALMSPVLNNTCSDAEQFSNQAKRAGSDTNANGDLDAVKGISAFGTNAPGIDLGDERILLGQRGTASYTVAKPWQMSEPVEARDDKGQLIGGKESYGEEYNAIHVPKPLYNRFTSVLFYSFSNR